MNCRFGFCASAMMCLTLAAASGEPGPADQQILQDFGLVEPEHPQSASRVSTEPQRLVYQGTPLAVTMAVGHEQRLVFDSPVRISVAPDAADALEPEIYGRNLLIVANRPVTTRLHAQLADGQILPIDLHAVSGNVSGRPLEIVRQSALDAQKSAGAESPNVPDEALGPTHGGPTYIDLVRFAAQQLYAPERLAETRPGLRQATVADRPVRMLRFSQASTRPIASWEQGGLFVTAVRVTNLQDAPIHLDPRRIVGRWRAAAFQHRRLPARAQTALYLVSDRPFSEALGIYGKLSAVRDAPVPDDMEGPD